MEAEGSEWAVRDLGRLLNRWELRCQKVDPRLLWCLLNMELQQVSPSIRGKHYPLSSISAEHPPCLLLTAADLWFGLLPVGRPRLPGPEHRLTDGRIESIFLTYLINYFLVSSHRPRTRMFKWIGDAKLARGVSVG